MSLHRCVAVPQSLPICRKGELVLAFCAPDQQVQPLTQLIEIPHAACRQPVFPFESEAQTQIRQFEQVQVPGRLRLKSIEELEEALSSPRFAVKRDQQALVPPAALISPRGVQYGLIDQGAQEIAGELDLLLQTPLAQRAVLKLSNLTGQLIAQFIDGVMEGKIAQFGYDREEGKGVGDEWIVAGLKIPSGIGVQSAGKISRCRRHDRRPPLAPPR